MVIQIIHIILIIYNMFYRVVDAQYIKAITVSIRDTRTRYKDSNAFVIFLLFSLRDSRIQMYWLTEIKCFTSPAFFLNMINSKNNDTRIR